MKLWIDDIRPAPEGYIWVKSVNEGKTLITYLVKHNVRVEVVDIDHDAGKYAKDGGDYIKLLDWLENMSYCIPIHIHSQNPVGVENMRRIIRRNGWKEV